MILLPGRYYILFIHTFVLLEFEFVFLLLIFLGGHWCMIWLHAHVGDMEKGGL